MICKTIHKNPHKAHTDCRPNTLQSAHNKAAIRPTKRIFQNGKYTYKAHILMLQYTKIRNMRLGKK